MNKYHETMIKAWESALEELIKPEDYDTMAHLEEEHWWFQQNQDEEQSQIAEGGRNGSYE
jgi:hypothetical protein